MKKWSRLSFSLILILFLVSTVNALVTENFSDGDYTTGPIVWTVNSGTWTAAAFYLNENNSADAWATIEGALTQDFSQTFWLNYSFFPQAEVGTQQHFFKWGASCTDGNNYPYYELRIDGTNQFNYRNSTATTTINNTFSATENTEEWNNVSIRENNGLHEIFLNGDLIINQTYSNTSVLDQDCIVIYTNDVQTPGTLYDDIIYSVEATAPVSTDLTVTLNSPSDTAGVSTTSVDFNATLAPAQNFNLTNGTLNVWYSNGTIFNQTTNTTVFQNTSTDMLYTVPGFSIGTYYWNVYGCQENSSNSVICASATNNFTFTQGVTNINITGFNINATQLFYTNLNVTFNTSGSVVSTKLWYNGSAKSTTTTNIVGEYYSANATIVPGGSVDGNISFFWEIIVDGISTNSSKGNQTVEPAVLALCNTSLTTPYMNFTFTNETADEEATTGTISSTWNYYGNDSTVYKTLSFTNTSENSWYAFCFSPTTKEIKTNLSLSWDNSISEQRSLSEVYTLTNTSTNIPLYLLPSSEGIFVTFLVTNNAEQPLSGVSGNVSDSGTLIASGLTSDAGIITFFLDPDQIYDFEFFKSGYPSFSSSFAPTQTSYTIILGTGILSTSTIDLTQGMEYSISPSTGTLLTNNTNTQFSFDLTSSFWTVNDFGFVIYNSSGHNINSTSASTNGGSLSLFIDTLNDTKYTMNYYWNVSNNITNGTVSWTVFDSSGTGYGLSNFFTHLKTYLGQGLLGGDDNFDLAIIAFIGIFLFTGVMSYKFGVTTPQIITAILLTAIIFVDIGLNLLPAQGMSTVIIGLFCIAIWVKEGIR